MAVQLPVIHAARSATSCASTWPGRLYSAGVAGPLPSSSSRSGRATGREQEWDENDQRPATDHVALLLAPILRKTRMAASR